MRIGIDFDNTLVEYGELFRQVALEAKLIPETISSNKQTIRDHIREHHGNDAWTFLQGEVYGKRMVNEATAALGSVECLRTWINNGHSLQIISHKTATPALGEQYDLRGAANEWLRNNLPTDLQKLIPIHFSDTLEGKLLEINNSKCELYIDDLLDVVAHPNFPKDVTPIWFNGNWPIHNNAIHCATWGEIQLVVDAIANEKTTNASIVQPLFGGANSQILIIGEDKNIVRKKYLSRTGNSAENRLRTEFLGLNFLYNIVGISQIPQPIAADLKNNFAYYSYIDGEQIPQNQIGNAEVESAAQLLGKIARSSSNINSASLPNAADACFSLSEHIAVIDSRLAKLEYVISSKLRTAESEALAQIGALKTWLDSALLPLWNQIKNLSHSNEYCVTSSERILSPSDVGFHNILREHSTKTLYAIDLEYFGWDDPAKMVADFIWQPSNPLPRNQSANFVRAIGKELPHLNWIDRFQLIFPLIGIKWCTIVLNPFLYETNDAELLNKRLELADGILFETNRVVANKTHSSWT